MLQTGVRDERKRDTHHALVYQSAGPSLFPPLVGRLYVNSQLPDGPTLKIIVEHVLLFGCPPEQSLSVFWYVQGARLGPVVRQLLVHFLVRRREPKINVLQFLQFLGS